VFSSCVAARTLAATALDKLGRIDILVHLVGAFAGGEKVEDTAETTLDRMFDLNFRSAFHMIGAVVPGMRGQGSGRILAIGSRAAAEPQAGTAAYSASKAALVALIRAVARENSDRCISANILLPGTIDTPVNRKADPKADYSKWVQPSQVAAMLAHVASDAAAEVNGAAIPLYGRDL
jgi:NAD(P)-dependent dehydrogenase (short-subunit alcohol dehydrogenase family)